jgi:hypothetical protein
MSSAGGWREHLGSRGPLRRDGDAARIPYKSSAEMVEVGDTVE